MHTTQDSKRRDPADAISFEDSVLRWGMATTAIIGGAADIMDSDAPHEVKVEVVGVPLERVAHSLAGSARYASSEDRRHAQYGLQLLATVLENAADQVDSDHRDLDDDGETTP
jgi:hypothetical protein